MTIARVHQHRPRPSWFQIALIAAVGPVLLAVMAIWFGAESRRSEGARHALQESFAYQREIEHLFSLVKDAETGQRGYLVSGDRSFLEPYDHANARIAGQIRRLEALRPAYADDREFERLKRLIAAKFAEMRMVVEMRDRAGADAAAEGVKQGDGKRQMDAIRRIVGRMEHQAVREMTAFQHSRARRIARNQTIIWGAIAFTAAAACLFGFLIGRGRRLNNRLAFERTEAAARQRAIFDSATDAILLINPSGSIETINPAAERMFGYTAEQLIRRDISTLVDIAPGDGVFLERVGVRDGQLQRTELIDLNGRDAHGEPVPVDIVLGTLPLPDGIHIVAALRDATGRKEIDRLKDDFISTVSHELRTPLTSVVGSLSLLRSGAAGTLPPEAQRLAEIAETNSQRLIRLINDILDIDQIRKGRMAFEYAVIDLRDVMTKAVHAMQGLADRRSITIDTRTPPAPVMACADADRLVQVAGNLLSNAVKFSPEGSTVTFELIEGREDHVVQITDSGPGIPPEFAENIFHRFARGRQPSRQIIAGTGLGLAISREIVRSHGGEISFENRSEGGARFAFSVPRDTTQASEPVTIGSARLLICEDDADAGRTIQSILTAHGYASDLVSTVREAIAHARSQRYAAILLDMTLADADGTDVIRAIVGDPSTGKPPIIVVSGIAPPAGTDHQPFASWLQKPFDPRRLIQLVQRAIRRQGQSKAVILHIDDDSDTRELFAAALAGRGLLLNASSLLSARSILSERRPDAIVLDLGLPDGSGLALLSEVKSWDKPLPVIVYSAQEMDEETRQLADAVLVKSRRALPKLASTVLDIVDRHGGPR
ncbi:histidine kinase [Sphingomonas sp. Root50]|nr:CHASE3 domain-containing protein [Sphingomonas sp. Root50]KQX20312.1 histidine kinase [Sphingomonas sp. Root1294]KQY67562.1 histidine kinase [Sphingomonas sp. Root50]KRB90938.1 histidine kinase [Sphingomonas sp. Root720]